MSSKKKYSRKREAILNAFKSTDIHPTAEWVYKELKPIYPDLSMGTVYRNILEFKKNDQLFTVCVLDGKERLDANTKPHAHFICDKCNCVLDLPQLQYNNSLNDFVSTKYDVKVEYQSIIFHGICGKCLKN